MQIASTVFIVLVALEHFYFLVLEMFLWSKPKGLATFHMTQEFANSTAVMAANQGLYNGFLAAGLIASFCFTNTETARAFRVFFLVCVIIAGIYGGATVGRRIFFLQSIPAAIALLLTIF
jgi:putative membrane protein